MSLKTLLRFYCDYRKCYRKKYGYFKANELLDEVFPVLQKERLDLENVFNQVFKKIIVLCNKRFHDQYLFGR